MCAPLTIGLDAEVEVGLRAGDGGAEVVVGGADLDDGGVVAVDLDDGRPDTPAIREAAF